MQGNRFEVAGSSKVAIYEKNKPYYFLSAGDRFDLKNAHANPLTMTPPLIEFQNVTVYRGEKIALDGITLSSNRSSASRALR